MAGGTAGYRSVVRILGGRYRLLRPIGVGGMSEVWHADDEVLDRSVAVKLLNRRESADPRAIERVRAEARCAARLTHPNAAAVYDFGLARDAEPAPVPYIVMELVDGRTLAEHLSARPLSWRIAVRVCAEVGAALGTAHAAGIVHGDVKPGNVMLSPSGAKVLDFGAAGWIGNGSGATVRGTLPYLAPERLRGATIGPSADTYSLGVLLYVCLTGDLPPEPEQRGGRLPALDALDPVLAELCADCLDLDPERRPGTLAATLILAEAVDARIYLPPLEAALAGVPISRPTGSELHAPTLNSPVVPGPREPLPAGERERSREHEPAVDREPARAGRHRA